MAEAAPDKDSRVKLAQDRAMLAADPRYDGLQPRDYRQSRKATGRGVQGRGRSQSSHATARLGAPILAFALCAAAAPGEVPLPQAPPLVAGVSHQDEIETFAMLLAVSQTVSNRCADIKINIPMLKVVRERLRIVDAADGETLVAAGRPILESIAQAVAAAASVGAWCDNAYSLFGPAGTTLPGLMSR